MKRTWTEHSKLNGTKAQKTALANAISRMEWVSPKSELSMMSIEAIKAMIQEFGIPKVSAISGDGLYRGAFGRAYNLIGVEGNYSNGKVRAYALDDGGSKLIPIATDFWSSEARSNPRRNPTKTERHEVAIERAHDKFLDAKSKVASLEQRLYRMGAPHGKLWGAAADRLTKARIARDKAAAEYERLNSR